MNSEKAQLIHHHAEAIAAKSNMQLQPIIQTIHYLESAWLKLIRACYQADAS
jgi:hypothetical protein